MVVGRRVTAIVVHKACGLAVAPMLVLRFGIQGDQVIIVHGLNGFQPRKQIESQRVHEAVVPEIV